MRTNKTVTYALACLKALAGQWGEFLQVAEIARRENLPAAYCQKILLALARAGIVESIKGRGFTLLRPAESITTLDVIRALSASEPREPQAESGTAARLIEEALSARLNRAFSELSLAEIVRA